MVLRFELVRITLLKDWVVVVIMGTLTFLVLLSGYLFFDFSFLWHSDTAYYTFHKLSIIKESLGESRAPTVPLLNRFEGGGVSLLHAGSVDLTSFIFLRWIDVLPFQIVLAFFYVSLSQVTFFLLVRSLKCSQGAALIASSFWAFNAYNLNYANEHVYAIFHLAVPFALLAIKQILESARHQPLWVIGLALSNSALFLTGRWALLQYCVIAYLVWCTHGSNSPKKVVVTVILVLATFLIAFFLSAFFSIPYLFETILDSTRSVRDDSPKYVHWLRLLVDHIAPGLSHDSASYFTPIVLLPFAVLGYLLPSPIRFFCLTTFLAFLFLAHPFGLFTLIQQLPFQAGNVVTIRFVFFYYLGFALALGFGIDHILNRKNQISERVTSIFRNSIYYVCGAIISIVVTVSIISVTHGTGVPPYLSVLEYLPIKNDFFGPVKTVFGLTGLSCSIALLVARASGVDFCRVSLYLLPTLLSLNFLVLVAVLDHVPRLEMIHLIHFAFVFALFFFYVRKQAISRRIVVGVLLAYTIGFSIAFNSSSSYREYDLTKTDERAASDWQSAANFLKQKTAEKPFRIAGDHESIVRLAKAGFLGEELGYFLPLPPKSIVNFFVDKNVIPAGPAPTQKDRPSRSFRQGNVKYYVRVVSGKKPGIDVSYSNSLELVFARGLIRIYEDKRVRSRLSFLPSTFLPNTSQSCVRGTFSNGSTHHPGNHESCDAELKLRKDEPGLYKITVSAPTRGLLMLSNRFDKNWIFTVNSRTVDPIKLEDFFIGIPLNRGVSEINGTFKVAAFHSLILLSLATFLALVFYGIYSFVRDQPPRS